MAVSIWPASMVVHGKIIVNWDTIGAERGFAGTAQIVTICPKRGILLVWAPECAAFLPQLADTISPSTSNCWNYKEDVRYLDVGLNRGDESDGQSESKNRPRQRRAQRVGYDKSGKRIIRGRHGAVGVGAGWLHAGHLGAGDPGVVYDARQETPRRSALCPGADSPGLSAPHRQLSPRRGSG